MNHTPFTSFQRKAGAHGAGRRAIGNDAGSKPGLFRKERAACLLLALLAVCAVAPTASAAEYSLSGGAVKFSAPDAWPVLMEKPEGTRQFVALQIKDPGNADALARITVTTEQVDGISGFQKFFQTGAERARKLPGYVAAAAPGDASGLRYTADENHAKTAYTEVYAYRANVAIQVRCIRPASAPVGWISTFDAGCQSVITAVEKAP